MKNHRSGFTLIEVLVVLVIMAILAALAIPSFNTMLVKRSVQGAAGALAADIRLARSEALRRSVTVTICGFAANSESVCTGSPANWANGWMVFVDNGVTPGVYDAGEEVIRVQQAPSNIATIQQPVASSTRLKYTFEANGVAKSASDTLVITPVGNASAMATRIVCISNTGRPSVRAEGAAGCS